MSTVKRLQSIRLDVTFHDVDKEITDPSSLVVSIYDPNNVAQVTEAEIGPLSSQIQWVGTGQYYFDYTVPAGGLEGTWIVRWGGVLSGKSFLKDDLFSVVSDITTIAAPGVVFENDTKLQFANTLRTYLKDRDPRNYAFQDEEIGVFLDGALADVNLWPTATNFNWDSVPQNWLHVVSVGGQVMALYAQSLIEAGREFTINDQGINFNPPPVHQAMLSVAQSLVQSYADLKERAKYHIKPGPAAIGTYRVLAINPMLARLRHLREKRIV